VLSGAEVALSIAVPVMAVIVDVVIYGARLKDIRDLFDARCDAFDAELSQGTAAAYRNIERTKQRNGRPRFPA